MRIWVISISLTLIISLIIRYIDQLEITPVINKPSNFVYDDLLLYCPRAVITYGVATLLVYFSWRTSTPIPPLLRLEAACISASKFRSMLLRTVKDIGTVRSRTGCWMRRFRTLCPLCCFNSIERKYRSADQYNLILCCFHNVFFKVSDIKLLPSSSLFLIN